MVDKPATIKLRKEKEFYRYVILFKIVKNLNDKVQFLGYSQVVKASIFDIDKQRFESFYSNTKEVFWLNKFCYDKL